MVCCAAGPRCSRWRQPLLDDVRRERAQQLLEAGELNISEIAQQLGFSDATAFGRAFRRWHGISPPEYRLAPRPGHGHVVRAVSAGEDASGL